MTSLLHHHFLPPLSSAHHAPNNIFSNSPLGLSPHSQHGSQSPDRRISNSGFAPRGGSPLNQSTRTSSPRSPPPGADCPHPTRMNSLTHRSSHPPSSASSLNPGTSSAGVGSENTDSPADVDTPPTQSSPATPQAPMPFQRTNSQPHVLFVGDKNAPNQRRNTFSAEERIRLSLRVRLVCYILYMLYALSSSYVQEQARVYVMNKFSESKINVKVRIFTSLCCKLLR